MCMPGLTGRDHPAVPTCLDRCLVFRSAACERQSRAMTVRVVEKDDWGQELDRFSRQHEGWIVSVRTQPVDGPTAVAAHDVPLRGVSRASPESDDITVTVGGDRGRLTHEIPRAVALQIDLTPEEAERALTVRSDDGTTTTIEFRSPMRSEDVDGWPASHP